MDSRQQFDIRVRSGFVAALGFAVAVIFLLFIIVLLIMAIRWSILQSSPFDRAYDINIVKDRMAIPVFAFAATFGCAGWATYVFPRGRYRYIPTLIILLAVSGPMWFLLFASPLNPRDFKSVDHPKIYLSESLMIILPPIIVCAIMTLRRIRIR